MSYHSHYFYCYVFCLCVYGGRGRGLRSVIQMWGAKGRRSRGLFRKWEKRLQTFNQICLRYLAGNGMGTMSQVLWIGHARQTVRENSAGSASRGEKQKREVAVVGSGAWFWSGLASLINFSESLGIDINNHQTRPRILPHGSMILARGWTQLYMNDTFKAASSPTLPGSIFGRSPPLKPKSPSNAVLVMSISQCIHLFALMLEENCREFCATVKY